MQNESMNTFRGGQGEEINLPPVPLRMENVSAFVALTHMRVNIPDVYHAEEFDFSGPKKFDEATGYRTLSMLVIPLENHEGTVIGVLQLINATDEDGNLIPFAQHYEKVVASLASQAAIFLTNIQLLRDIENLFNSFVDVMATAIDSRTPYNANHSRRVALLAGQLAQAVDKENEGRWGSEYFDEERVAQLVMAGWLHDIGKIATPLEVMDKASRIERQLELVMQRFDYIYAELRNQYLERKLNAMQSGCEQIEDVEKWWEQERQALEEARDLILKMDNPATFVDKELQDRIKEVAVRTYIDPTGRELPWLKDEELHCLCVVKGTLTDEERKIMEDHVVVTGRMLDKMPFTLKLKDVPYFASIHHEHLNGKGYPNGLAGEQIPIEGRILALVDVFDALTADDRPYKKAMPLEQALKILGFMVKDQQLDGDLLDIFIRHQVWEKI
ncbi:HD domain-containing phosphohydrolase [Syntrophomonas palmitatica]|uniref:HD domain-containing phosphohydrolase n=1 Tax=Syntrophomonas palmitatica TaxID=402877 RepID=UPI00241DC201|nr:HD domain-containing phosphohydrolase [Syntrophomonas palmitatica]